MSNNTWRRFKIRPRYNRNIGTVKEFLAPDLMTAFSLARAEWPGADTWESL